MIRWLLNLFGSTFVILLVCNVGRSERKFIKWPHNRDYWYYVLNITIVELLWVNLLSLFSKIDAIRYLVGGILGLHSIISINILLNSVGLLLTFIVLLDKCNLSHLVSYTLQALLLQLSQKSRHSMNLGEEEVLVQFIKLTCHTQTDK